MPELSRRDFLVAAMAMGATVAVSPRLEAAIRHVTGSGSPELFYFNAARARTCSAICARIVPSGTDPSKDPGATEARAVVFIDRFLAAFDLPAAVADGPAIYIHGRFSDRNDHHGDDFLSGRRAHFLTLTGHQEISWRAELYGVSALDHPPAGTHVSKKWRAQVGNLLPAPVSIRKTYADGLDAFDAYSKKTFGTPFASAASLEQDLMLEAAGNVVASNFPIPTPPGAPDAAKALFPLIVVHTFQATYGLPEYRGQHTDAGVWRSVGWDGDTQPLGNSIYDEHAFGPGKGPNQGFGDPHVYLPRGGYRERRPVSTLGGGDGVALNKKDIAPLVKALRAQARAARKARRT
ncbi:MAG: gluconate 2-dehydrogenase subunit 3 family protein [Actinobacteria bacterium]|nr:MAG: gluconate 2-dehydrogenase subunit 3 family protein [Actinomycetota bacterium]